MEQQVAAGQPAPDAGVPVTPDPVQRVGTDGGPAVDGERCDAVVLAMPDPQARRLLEPGGVDDLEAQGTEAARAFVARRAAETAGLALIAAALYLAWRAGGA